MGNNPSGKKAGEKKTSSAPIKVTRQVTPNVAPSYLVADNLVIDTSKNMSKMDNPF